MEPLFLDTRNQENISQDKNFWFLYFSIQHFFFILFALFRGEHLTPHSSHLTLSNFLSF